MNQESSLNEPICTLIPSILYVETGGINRETFCAHNKRIGAIVRGCYGLTIVNTIVKFTL